MFGISLSIVLVTLFYMILGFVIRKMNKASETHLQTLSGILIYICNPFLEISAFMSLDFSVSETIEMLKFFIVSFFLQSIFMLILYLILRRKYSESKYRLLTIASVLGNVGFFGMPITRALLPDNPEVACYCAVNMVTMNILIFTVGVFCLTNDKKYISVKSALFNPTIFGFVIALPFYIFGIKNILPDTFIGAINTIADISTPLCMFILGIRLASVKLKSVFSKPIVYIICLMKLVVFPCFCFAVVSLLPVSSVFRSAVTILAATPCASFTLALSEMHESEPDMAAKCILVSSVLCFITIPTITLLL